MMKLLTRLGLAAGVAVVFLVGGAGVTSVQASIEPCEDCVFVPSRIPEVRSLEDAQIKALKGTSYSLENFYGGTAGTVNSETQEIEQNSAGGVGTWLAVLYSYIGRGRPYVNESGEVASGDSAIKSAGRAMAYLYKSPPASTEMYVAYVLRSANVVQPAYAQGLGYGSLTPFLDTWVIFRDVAFVFYILVFLVIGFMILLRRKVGQTAVTAQQAIPRVILSMILVTFSFAISGLLIDLMYLTMYLIGGLFGITEIANDSIFSLGGKLITSGMGTAYELVSGIFEDTFNIPIIDFLDAFEVVGGITAALIVAVAVLFAMFSLFFELLKTYATIVSYIVMGPLLIMMDAIPGRSNFRSWLQSMIGNLAAFPAVMLVLVLYQKLTTGNINDGGFMPPYLIGNFDAAETIPFVIGLGLLLGLPEAVKKIKTALGAKGGPIEDIVKAGYARATKAEVVLPIAASTVGGGVGGYQAYQQAKREDVRGLGKMYKAVMQGSDFGGGITAPGLTRGWNSGLSKGQKVREWIDAVRDGTIINPDRQLGALKSLVDNQKAAKRAEAIKARSEAGSTGSGTGS